MTAPDAREAILARIRAAVADLPREPVAVPRGYLRHAPGVDPADREAVLDLFAERLGEYGAAVHRVTGAELPATVARVLPGDSAVLPAGLPRAWLVDWNGTVTVDQPPLSKEQLDGTGCVVTSCAVAIAESGTIVLDAGPGQGRRA